jgi:TRAP transporter TAXI family solute receptor
MRFSSFARAGSALIGATMLLTMPAAAQVVGIGTTKGGANAAVGAAIAKVVSDSAGFQMRPQKMGGTQQYMAIVNAGDLEFGLSNVMQFGMAVDGAGMSDGKPHPDMRLVATLMQFRNGVIVGKESGINSLADLKGKRIPDGYAAAPLFSVFKDAFLASAGLTMDDVTPVPVVGLPQSWAAFREGKVDMTIAAAGAGAVREMEAAISGGIKYIPLIEEEAVRAALPRTRFAVIEPAKPLVGVLEPTLFNVYEYVLFANASVDEETVYKVVAAIIDGEKDLRATSPLWKTYKPANIATQFDGLQYHPGAVKYFREKGLWKE